LNKHITRLNSAQLYLLITRVDDEDGAPTAGAAPQKLKDTV